MVLDDPDVFIEKQQNDGEKIPYKKQIEILNEFIKLLDTKELDKIFLERTFGDNIEIYKTFQKKI
jgi:hypothetical protein